ncbi:MAG: aminomethyl-transferring glycine dehydrogenase [Crocinitomicaceae bacterium]|nr:aminomethyl-transferring glycine dehydrogenase [Crocinitomicaceae bacterium]
MSSTHFAARHIGPRSNETKAMLQTIGVQSIDELIEKTVPAAIRLQQPLSVGAALSEDTYLARVWSLAQKNKIHKSYIGMGYHPTITPAVILRNVLENPGWYTAYTPYQAEIAQGRLEALLNFQTIVSELTGLPIANASLLDEGTAAAEAMILFRHSMTKEKEQSGANKFFVDREVFPQTIDVLKGRASRLKVELVVGNYSDHIFTGDYFGAIVQYPNNSGQINDYKRFAENAHAAGVFIAAAADLLSLSLITPPGEWGADVCLGSSQRFGVPMGYGGPHAAFFCAKEDFKRNMPGRIIGVSKDRHGNMAYRMALQTREQHIRREKATSNICTAQALLAVMSSMYGVYHGPDGILSIAERVHRSAFALAEVLKTKGLENENTSFFDTIKLKVSSESNVRSVAEKMGVNLRYFGTGHVGISINEATTTEDLSELVEIFTSASLPVSVSPGVGYKGFERSSSYMTHPVFNTHHSETEMLRYLKKLENKDLSLVHAMIPLGSCTMKLNATSEMIPVTWPEFANIHPFAPVDQTTGYQEMLRELENDLCKCTGFAGVSLQPNSGAQGELAGLLVIMAYHASRGEQQRNICLIPSSAHGTNPASAVMAGLEVVVVKCDENGNVDVSDLKLKSEQYKDRLAALMITYPSTHGVYEEAIREITHIVHENGGQVYMDGANMNAQVGLTNPGNIGADVCHLNLHKTFAIPHGGGGPGVGPIGVAQHLVPFLPGNQVIKTGGEQAIPAVSSAPWGSALILLISYGYIKMLGSEGLTKATCYAILNANYMRARLGKHYDVLYTGAHGTVAHEMILDCRSFKAAGIEVEDIAKRLMDYGFHAPTVSFPVAGTLMVEPTESEPKAELDRFCDAMIAIRKEIAEVESGEADKQDNVLKMAPHTALELTADEWHHSYSREKAAYPAAILRHNKFWSSVGRVDNAYGDRNLVCTCPPLEEYEALGV